MQAGPDAQQREGKYVGPHKHWQPGLKDRFCKFMLSITFQAGVQSATGEPSFAETGGLPPSASNNRCT